MGPEPLPIPSHLVRGTRSPSPQTPPLHLQCFTWSASSILAHLDVKVGGASECSWGHSARIREDHWPWRREASRREIGVVLDPKEARDEVRRRLRVDFRQHGDDRAGGRARYQGGG